MYVRMVWGIGQPEPGATDSASCSCEDGVGLAKGGGRLECVGYWLCIVLTTTRQISTVM